MRLYRWVSGILPAASIVMCQACHGGGSEEAAPPASASAAVAAAPEAGPPPRPRTRVARHGGLASALFHDAHDLDLTPPQQEGLQPIEAALKADDEAIRAAMKAFRSDLSAGLRADKLETAKLTADDAVVDKAMADHAANEAAALDQLHALLTPAQRASLVTSIQTRQNERETRTMGWLKAKEADGGAPDWSKRRLDRLTAQLTLDAAQQKQVAAILAKAKDPPNTAVFEGRWDDHKKRTDALLAAFASDTFDGKKVDLTLLPGKTAHDAMDHMAAFFTQIMPVLRPDQRERLGNALDRPLGAGWGPRAAMTGPMGMGPPPVRDIIDDIAFPFTEPPPSREDHEPPITPPAPSAPAPGAPAAASAH
jgi:Spy/CpxP family protein refolding chaperone